MPRRATLGLIILTLFAAIVFAQEASTVDPRSNDQKESAPSPLSPTQTQRVADVRDRVLFSDETERIGPLTKKLVRNILMDQKDIWTSPLHMSREDMSAWIVIGGATAGLVASDHWSVKQLPNTVDQVSVSRDVSQIGAVYTILPVTAGLYIGGAIGHSPKARETAILGGEAVLDSMITVGVLKAVFRRQRPLESNSEDFFRSGDSFPSGHAALSFALASVVAHEYNSNVLYPIAAYGLASLVSFSRLSGQKHFPSDIVAGASIGWFIGRYVFKTHVNHAIHMRPPSRLSQLRPRAVLPIWDPTTGTRGIALSWPHTR